MRILTIVGLLIVLIGCSCNQRISKAGPSSDSGLIINNEIRRGISYTDSLGSNYSLRYIPITITNDRATSMLFQIAFAKEYNHLPHPDFNEHFKLIPMPKEWADTISITKSMIDDLKNYIENPILNETIEPGEKFVLAIGALYDEHPECGIVPKVLFSERDTDNFQACDSRMNQDKSTHPPLALGLKLDFCERCILIPCGQVSYPEH